MSGILLSQTVQLRTQIRLSEDLFSLVALPPGWDGEDANPLNPKTIENARRFGEIFLAVLPSPDVIPNANGTVGLEWNSEDGFAYLEIGRTTFSLLVETHGEAPVQVQDSSAIPDSLLARYAEVVAGYLFPSPASSFVFHYDSSSQYLYRAGQRPAPSTASSFEVSPGGLEGSMRLRLA